MIKQPADDDGEHREQSELQLFDHGSIFGGGAPVGTFGRPARFRHPSLSHGSRSGTFVSLNQLSVDKDSILLGSQACQKKLALLLDDDIVTLRNADREFISLSEVERKHSKVFHGNLAVNQNI